MYELKPCPHCGEEPQFVEEGVYSIFICPQCGIQSTTYTVFGIEKAIAEWNKKVEEAK